MFKNLSINKLVFYVTLTLTIVNSIFIFSYFFIVGSFQFDIWFVVFLISTSILNFLLVKKILDEAVFRKIKIIYKIIRDTKISNKEKPKDIGNNTIDNVQGDVLDWTKDTQEEIKYLKSLETYRKDYVGNISHELKTPLTSIQGYLHTLMDGALYDEKINEKYLQKAIVNVERLHHIIKDLDSITKLEREENKLNISTFDIKELTQEVLEDLQMMAKDRDISLSFKEGTAPAFKVAADREAIRQVLNNLIVNSIKYGNEGGNTKISFYDLDKQVLVEVSDNGIGIEEKHLKHLFDRFYRADNSRSRKMGGSGLGLAIVKHVIEAHKQSINVRSTIDLGSTFGFTLSKV